MNVTLGMLDNFQLEEYESRFKVPSIESHFCDNLAEIFKPIIYGGDYTEPEPEGIYYRVLYRPNLNLKPPKPFPIGIVNAGYSKGLDMSCRFHKTEILMKEFAGAIYLNNLQPMFGITSCSHVFSGA